MASIVHAQSAIDEGKPRQRATTRTRLTSRGYGRFSIRLGRTWIVSTERRSSTSVSTLAGRSRLHWRRTTMSSSLMASFCSGPELLDSWDPHIFVAASVDEILRWTLQRDVLRIRRGGCAFGSTDSISLQKLWDSTLLYHGGNAPLPSRFCCNWSQPVATVLAC